MTTPPSYPPPPGTPPSFPPPSGSGGMSQSEERTWALASHVGSLVAAVVAMAFLAPLLVLLVHGEKSPFVRRHAVESLNFQISLLIYSLAGTVIGIVIAILTVGIALLLIIPLVAILALVVLILIIVATVRAANGEDYRYPFCLRFIN